MLPEPLSKQIFSLEYAMYFFFTTFFYISYLHLEKHTFVFPTFFIEVPNTEWYTNLCKSCTHDSTFLFFSFPLMNPPSFFVDFSFSLFFPIKLITSIQGYIANNLSFCCEFFQLDVTTSFLNLQLKITAS